MSNSEAQLSKKSLKKSLHQQESIDGSLIFNIFINDLVLFIQYAILGNYAEDSNICLVEAIKKIL